MGSAVWILVAAAGPSMPRPGATVLVLVLLGGLLVHVLKLALGMPRPVAVLGMHNVEVVGIALFTRAFPSGHAAMLSALAAAAWCWPGGRPRRPEDYVLPALFSALAVGGALARVIAGAHWPSDVLAGAALGLAIGTLCVADRRAWRLIDLLSSFMAGRAGSRIVAASLAATGGAVWVAHVDYPMARGLQALLTGVAALGALRWWLWHPGPWGRRDRSKELGWSARGPAT
jgi:undecaprenyl-diphosphatase